MRRSLTVLLGCSVTTFLLAGCGDDSSTTSSEPTAVAGGTVACDYLALPVEEDNGADVLTERWICTVEMSDERVSGTEELEFITRVDDWTDRAIPTSGEGVLSNDVGSWRGSGTAVFKPEGGSPINYGEMTYLGEGDYAGLRYRYFYYGTNNGAEYAGWIEPIE
jgi:hypothetical protein